MESLLPIHAAAVVELEPEDIQKGIDSAHAFIAAVVAINDAIEGEDEDELLVALQNVDARLSGVETKGKNDYLTVMYEKI